MREELHLGEFLREIDQQKKIKWLEIQPLFLCLKMEQKKLKNIL